MSVFVANLAEYEAIATTVQHYIDGAKTGKGAAMEPAFHPDATIQGYFEGELFAGTIRLLFDYVDQDKPATGLKWRITSVDIAGTIANARVELDDWNGHRFTDLFNLLKVDGNWKIMNKVFHTHPT